MNLYDGFSEPAAGSERFDLLLSRKPVRIERIASNRYENGAWYDQETAEWVCLLRGTAVIEFEGKAMQPLRAGDTLLIAAHARHRVTETSGDALWLAVHFIDSE